MSQYITNIKIVSDNYAVQPDDQYIGCLTQQKSIYIKLANLSGVNEGATIIIKDDGGNAANNPILVSCSDFSTLIDNERAQIINVNFGSLTLVKRSTGYSISAGIGTSETVTAGEIPGYTTSELPIATGEVRFARLLDDNKGLKTSNGTLWTPVNGMKVYVFEDFGGIPNDSSTAARLANNIAFSSVMSAINAASFYPIPAKVGAIVIFDGSDYYFSSVAQINTPCELRGISSQYNGSRTRFFFPPKSTGIHILNFVDAGKNITIPRILGIGIQHDQVLATWASDTVYATGSAVRPTEWGDYVMIATVGGQSGVSEPNWPENLQVIQAPAGAAGHTITDNTITWTAAQCPLLFIESTSYLFDVTPSNGYGSGIIVVGDTDHSLTDACIFDRVTPHDNLSSGLQVFGQDANICDFSNVLCLFNGAWGVYDVGFLGNTYRMLDCSYNGPEVWIAERHQSLEDRIGATQPNGYEFKCTTAGTTGSVEPAWTANVGTTVSDGSVVWTCARKFSGGGWNINGTVYSGYSEGGYLPCVMNGGSATALFTTASYRKDQTGWVIHNQTGMGPFSTTGQSSSLTTDTIVTVGDQVKGSYFQSFQTKLKDGTAVGEIDLLLDAQGYLNWTYDGGGGGAFLQMPFSNSTNKIPSFIKGISLSIQSSGNSTNIIPGTIPPTVGRQGDRAFTRMGLYSTGAAAQFTAIDDTGTAWEEAAWSAPTSGGRLDPFAEYGETNLHFLIDDVRSIFNPVYGPPETIYSRKNSYPMTWINGTGFDIVTVPQIYGNATGVVYDSSQRTRKVFSNRSSNAAYGLIASNSAHVLPASGTITLEVIWYSQNLSVSNTLFGYQTSDGHSGYQFKSNTDGTLVFSAQNTSATNFINLSSTSSISTGQYQVATITFDSVSPSYSLWINGVQASVTTTSSGTLGTTAADIGFGGLLTNGVLTGPCASQWPLELLRHSRILTSTEIKNRASQIRALNGLSTLT